MYTTVVDGKNNMNEENPVVLGVGLIAVRSDEKLHKPNNSNNMSLHIHIYQHKICKFVTDHRELHATVSRVGKSIDRHFISDYASVAPKAESFCNEANRPIMEQAIAQHLYRQVLTHDSVILTYPV